jgi:DNA-directed RNA polymerase subunit RPC12/RpoP
MLFQKVETNQNDELRKILCERCRKFFPLGQIKYMPTGNDSRMALCSKCMAIPVEDRKKKIESIKQPFFCVRCKYKFNFSPNGVTGLKCPYCGKDDKIVLDKPGSASTLIKEV